MADNNRLELDIVATDDTGAATAKARSNFKSVEEEAAKAAAGMSSTYEAASASVMRSLQSLEQRATLIGTSGVAKMVAQRDALINRAGSDVAAGKRISDAYDKIISAQQRLDNASATRQAGISAGKATLSGEAGFQAALKAVQSRETEIRLLEERAKRATLSRPDLLRDELGGLLSQRGLTDSVAQRYRTSYAAMIKAAEEEEKKHASEHGGNLSTMVLRRSFLAAKDFSEGRVQGTVAEAADIMFGQGGTGGVVQKAIPAIADIAGVSSGAVIAVSSLSAAFIGLGIAGLVSAKHLAETGEQIHNFSLRTGIPTERVQAFQFAAKAAGQDPNLVESLSRDLSRAADDYSPEGSKRRGYLKDKLGVDLFDDIGGLRSTEQIFLGIADGINKLPTPLERSGAAIKIFGERGAEALPVLEKLRENLSKSDQIGNTFTESDLKMFEEWKHQMAIMDEEWQRFKANIMKPLAVTATVTMHVINEAFSGGKDAAKEYGSPYASVLEPGINNALASQGYFSDVNIPRPKAPGVPSDLDPYNVALRRRKEADALIEGRRQSDPEARRRDIERQMSEIGAPIEGRTPPDKVREYYALQDQLNSLKQKGGSAGASQALEGVVAARKQGLDLDAKYAEIQASAKQKELSASLNTGKELMSPEDIATRLRLAELTAIAQKDKEIESRRRTVDTKTGREIDLTGTPDFEKFRAAEEATLPKRIRNEYAVVLSEIEAEQARFFKARTDADGKAWQEAWRNQKKGLMQLQDEALKIGQETQTHKFDIDASAIDRQKEIALQGLGAGGLNAQTIKEKIALEDQKLAIEDTFAERSLANRIAKLQRDETLAVGAVQKEAFEKGNTGSTQEADAIAATQGKYQQEIDAARATTSDKELIDAQKTANEKAKLQIESNKKVYESLKHDAEGLFDQLVFHTKSWGEFAKDIFKATVLTPVKEIFSSQVAALFTKGLTGQDVTFGEVGNGQGAFGKLGSIFGRAGLGQPRFGDASHPLAKLGAPNHIGDLGLVNGSVPVVLMNAPQVGAAHAEAANASFGAITTGLGLAGLLGSVASAAPTSAAAEAVTSTITYAGGGSESFGGLANLVGGPGGTSGFAGPVAGYGGTASSGGGILSGLPGMLGNLKNLFGLGSSGTDLGNGVGIANSGVLGRLAAFGKSGGAAILGGSLALDGIRRGGVLGTLEGAGGGALVGFKYGGVLGAGIGAAIGGGIAAFKSLLGGGDRKHAKDLVKQVYGMDINDSTADQIVAIAKQSYGNQIDVAVRSQQVRDLLKLYSQATGQKGAEDRFVQDSIHSASFSESGGKLFQNAVYDNGNAYAYSSPLATYGGVNTSPLQTYAPNNGVFSGNLQISLNGQSASNALAGQVVRVATPGFVQGQALAASGSSNGRTAQQNMALSPSALTR